MKIFYSWNILCYLQALVLIIIFKKMPFCRTSLYTVPLCLKCCLNSRWFLCSCIGLVWVGVAGFRPQWTLEPHGGEGELCPRACRVLLATGVLTVLGEVGRMGSRGPGLLIFWVGALQGFQQLQSGCPHAAVTLSGPVQEVRAGGCGAPARPFRVTRRSSTLPLWL